MRDHKISQGRACQQVGVDLKTVRRDRPPDCPEIRCEMWEVASQRRGFVRDNTGAVIGYEGTVV